MTDDADDADDLGTEKQLLLAWMRSTRQHVLATLDGVADGDLRRGVLPSGWTMLGAVQHLALDVERWWFRRVMADESTEVVEDNRAWVVGDGIPAADVLALYRDEAAQD